MESQGTIGTDELRRRVRAELVRIGYPDGSRFMRDSAFGAALPDVTQLRAAFARAYELNAPRTRFPASLERVPLFRLGILRRVALKLYNALFVEQRRLVSEVIELQRLQNDAIARLAGAIVEIERAAGEAAAEAGAPGGRPEARGGTGAS